MAKSPLGQDHVRLSMPKKKRTFSETATPAACQSRGRTDRVDAARVKERMTSVVVLFDMVKVDRRPDVRVLVKRAYVVPERRILGERASVALEVPEIDRIEPDQRREQANIRFGQRLADKVASLCESRLKPPERIEHAGDGLLVSRLAGGEPGLVNTVIERVTAARVDRDDLALIGGGVIVALAGAELIECGVEHPQDVGGLVRDDSHFRCVEQDRPSLSTSCFR